LKEEGITSYDQNINYDNIPNMYDKCPHCEHEENKWISEVLEDAVMKVRCKHCENTYYINFGK